MKHRAEYLRVARDGWSRSTPGVVVQVLLRAPAPKAGVPADGKDTAGETAAGGAVVGSAMTAVAQTAAGDIRLGITASRKVGNAVERNRVRRRLRAAAGIVLPVDGRSGCDYVLVGRRETLTRPFAALLEDLRDAVRRALSAGSTRRPRADGRASGRRNAPGRSR